MDNMDVVRNLMASFQRFKHSFRPHYNPFPGLKPSEIGLLFHIRASCDGTDGISVSTLSRRMNVTSPSITQTVTALEERGLVERRMDEEDRRGVKVSLTEEGERITHNAETQLLEMLSGLVEHLGHERSIEFVNLLNEAIDYISKNHSRQGVL